MNKILLIDDDPDVAKLLKLKLEATSLYNVLFATGGQVGLAVAQSERPDLVICDIDMPDIDGGSVAAALESLENTKNIPLIFLSSIISPEDAQEHQTLGRWPLVSKQSPIEEIIGHIEKALTRAQ